MKNLLFVHSNNGKPFISTIDIYAGFEYKKHEQLKRVIKAHEKEFLERGILDFVESSIKGRGQPEKSYLLNERHFILLCLLVKNTPNSVKIKSAIEAEFSSLRKLKNDPARQEAITEKRKSGSLMAEVFKASREAIGKKTEAFKFGNEHKFCNRALTGEYQILDDSTLDAYDLKLLEAIRRKNITLMLLYPAQKDRKELMDQFVQEYREKNQPHQPTITQENNHATSRI